MPFASALSAHPVTAHAVGEVAGQVLEQLGAQPDLALLFVTPGHAGALEDAATALRSILSPGVLIGCAAESVVGTGQEIEDRPGVSLWAGHVGDVRPVLLDVHGSATTLEVGGLPGASTDGDVLLLLGDPYSLPVDAVFETMADRCPGLAVIGGMASAGRGPGGNRLVLNDQLVSSGAVGALLAGGDRPSLHSLVSQGCRPVGRPLTVTRSEGTIIYELAGTPAFQRILALAETLSPDEVGLINRGGLHIGVVIDEHKLEFGPGDFLIRNVLGADQNNGAIQVGDEVPLGATVQFHLRDADAADHDLRAVLAGAEADAALLFTCNGRGRRLFGVPDHDAGVLADALGPVPTAGAFCAGEFGPVGGRNFIHGFTASIALFGTREPA